MNLVEKRFNKYIIYPSLYQQIFTIPDNKVIHRIVKRKNCLVIKDMVAKSKLWEKTKVTTTLFDNFCGHEFFLVKDGIASFEMETLHTIGETIF